jgi:hypothetical protein
MQNEAKRGRKRGRREIEKGGMGSEKISTACCGYLLFRILVFEYTSTTVTAIY